MSPRPLSPTSTNDVPAPSAEPAAPPAFDPGFAGRHPCRLLVAEDDLVNQKVVVSMLRRLGYRPEVRNDGLQVIAALHGQPFDVLLMDVEMPELDGPAAAARIRREFAPADQPVIVALTAHTAGGIRERLLQCGMDEYLAKPLQLGRLTEVLARWPELRRSA